MELAEDASPEMVTSALPPVVDGEMTPWSPVELAEASESETVSSALPPVEGDITPSLAAELLVDTSPETVIAALPDSWIGDAVEETDALSSTFGEGETTPAAPEEVAAADSPLRVKTADPSRTEVTLMVVTIAVAVALGVMAPLPAADASTAEEKNVVVSPFPPVVDADTKVGVASPLSPVMVLVSVPEIMVVSPPPMIVVTSTRVVVLPSIVEAACSMVRV